jgi:hypothetical protein
VNLSAANIIVQDTAAAIGDVLDAIGGHFVQLGATLLHSDIFLCNLPKRAIKHGNIVLDPKTNVRIEVERLVMRCLPVRRP